MWVRCDEEKAIGREDVLCFACLAHDKEIAEQGIQCIAHDGNECCRITDHMSASQDA